MAMSSASGPRGEISLASFHAAFFNREESLAEAVGMGIWNNTLVRTYLISHET